MHYWLRGMDVPGCIFGIDLPVEKTYEHRT